MFGGHLASKQITFRIFAGLTGTRFEKCALMMSSHCTVTLGIVLGCWGCLKFSSLMFYNGVAMWPQLTCHP